MPEAAATTGSATPPVAVLALVFNALVWGVSWYALRLLQGYGLHPLWSTALMFALASVAVALWKPGALRPILRHPSLWLVAVTSGVTNAAFNWGVSIGEVVRVVLLFYLMPLWTALLARAFLQERLTWPLGLRVGLALVGAAIVLKPAGAAWPTPQGLSDWLGLLAGFTFALSSVTLRRAAALDDATRAMAMLAGSTLVPGALGVALAVSGAIAWPPPPVPEWLALVAAIAVAFLASNLAYQYGAARLPPNVTAAVMITEVLFAAVSAIVFGDEALTGTLLAGGACILSAAILAVRAVPAGTPAVALGNQSRPRRSG